ncbi:MAG: exodeoxyribonuclease VII large subunit [Myxococcales bacterium]|nr:exodeoxyribonuclease VII large subunit [Myxococcales bacterium]
MTWGSQPQSTQPDIWTPSRCNQAVQERLRGLRGLRVRGEVSGPRLSRGHLYFELKDSGARLRCTAWRSTVERQRLNLKAGQEIICHGYIDLWVAGGAYSLIVTRVEVAGVGARWAELQRLKAQLQSEGVFARSRPLPPLPRCVGIVTARTGAALHDMLRVIHERYPVRVVLAPAKVQGQGAAESIAAAVHALDSSGLCDVLIVGRGGGSIEDLWAFNTEPVVRAIVACQAVVVSAVGHETDTLLSDHAADVRAATPSVAAELVVPRMSDLRFTLRDAGARMMGVLRRRLLTERRHLKLVAERLGGGESLVARRRELLGRYRLQMAASQSERLAKLRRRLDGLSKRLHRAHPIRQLAERRRRHDAAYGALKTAIHQQLGGQSADHAALHERLLRLGSSGQVTTKHRAQLERMVTLLGALNPRAALGRGFSIVRAADTGAPLRDASDATIGQQLSIILARGALGVTVDQVHNESQVPEQTGSESAS